MDVLGTDISGLPMFLITKYITHVHRDMKVQMCAHRQANARTHAHTALRGRQY